MKNIKYILLTGLILGFASCKDPVGIYEKYIVPNGLIYPMPAQNAIAKPGNKRIEIAWDHGVDRTVEKARIFWNNYTDSVEVAINPDQKVISRIIGPIAENTYSFMIHTYDVDGNISIPIEVMSKVYGDAYAGSLQNRILKNTVYDGLDLTLNWGGAGNTEAGINVNYTDIHGNNSTVVVDPSETVTLLPNFDVDKSLTYSTVYLPDSLAIDLFYSPTVETKIDPVIVIPKNTWREFALPGDIGAVNATLVMPNMWNGSSTGNSFHTVENQPLPCMFTWDMGVMTKLTRMSVWPRDNANADDIWRRGHPREFEIYGSLEPNPDGSLDSSWKLLGKFEIVNPSPEIENPWTNASLVAFAKAGFEFEFVPKELISTAATVRYIRFYAISNFRGASEAKTTPISIGEITFWGRLVR